MVTVQVLGHLKMIDPAQIQSKPLHLCGECPSHHLGWEVDQEILSLTLNIALSLRPRVILRVKRQVPRCLAHLEACALVDGFWSSGKGFPGPSLPS